MGEKRGCEGSHTARLIGIKWSEIELCVAVKCTLDTVESEKVWMEIEYVVEVEPLHSLNVSCSIFFAFYPKCNSNPVTRVMKTGIRT